MSLFTKLFGGSKSTLKQPIENSETIPISQATTGSELYEWLAGGLQSAGMTVNESSAMSVSAVYACTSLIGGSIASLPLSVYSRSSDGSRVSVRDGLWDLLNNQPNDNWSSAVAKEFGTQAMLLHGNWYWRIIRGGPSLASVVGFEPLHPDNVQPARSSTGGLVYRITDPLTNRVYGLDQSDMIHVPGPGFNGLTGMSQIRYVLRSAAGTALAADQYGQSFFQNGARPDFALEVEGKLTLEQQDMIRRTWVDRHRGPSNAGKPALLTGGMTVKELSMNPEDAQLLETRKFQVEDIARIFGVPAHMIGQTDNASSWGTGVEQMSIGFVKYTLQRHLVKIENEINRKIFARTNQFCEFNVSGLERGDYKTRNDGYRIAVGRAGEPGWMTINEVRKLENLPPIDGGDTLGAMNEQQPTQPA